MMTIYYKFNNHIDVQAYFSQYLGEDNSFPSYVGDVAVANIGDGYLDASGNLIDGVFVMASAELIGYAQKRFIPPEGALFPTFALPETVEAVPYEIARWQAKMTLLNAVDKDGVKLWDKVLALRAQLQDPKLEIAMEAALYDVLNWQRNSPTVNMVAEAIGLSSKEVDELFINASKFVL